MIRAWSTTAVIAAVLISLACASCAPDVINQDVKDRVQSGTPRYVAQIPAYGGPLLNIADRTLKMHPNWPPGKHPDNEDPFWEEYFQKLQDSQQGDVSLFYDETNGPVLFITTRRAMPLGKGTLEALPEKIEPKLEHMLVVPVDKGDRFLLATVQGKYALVRVVYKPEYDLMLQCVYQPDGSTVFPRFKADSWRVDDLSGRFTFGTRDVHGMAGQLLYSGIPVCYEQSPKERERRSRMWPPVDLKGWEKKWPRVVLKGAVEVGDALNAFTAQRREYAWKMIGDKSIPFIFPAEGGFLSRTIPDELAGPYEGSWIELVKKCMAGTGVEFPPVDILTGLVPTIPPDRSVEVLIARGDSLAEVLGNVCVASDMVFRVFFDPNDVPQLTWKTRDTSRFSEPRKATALSSVGRKLGSVPGFCGGHRACGE